MNSNPERTPLLVQLIAALGGGAGIVALIAFFLGQGIPDGTNNTSRSSDTINNNSPKIIIVNKHDSPSQSDTQNSNHNPSSTDSDTRKPSDSNTSNNSSAAFPLGSFKDEKWLISLSDENDGFHYRGEELATGESLHLTGAIVSGNSQRKIYTWNNGGYRYQIIWQPQNPNFIRLIVSASNGEILNRLLRKA
jgi:hypothetical protein